MIDFNMLRRKEVFYPYIYVIFNRDCFKLFLFLKKLRSFAQI